MCIGLIGRGGYLFVRLFVRLCPCLLACLFNLHFFAGWFDNSGAEPSGRVGAGALVVHGHRHCRLSNITQEGKWKKTERFQIGDRFVVRLKGDKVGRAMLPWRILRKKHPEMFEKLDVYTQPSGYVDAIIQTWMVEDQSERYPGSSFSGSIC